MSHRATSKTSAKAPTPKPANTSTTAVNTDLGKRRGGGRPRKNFNKENIPVSRPSAAPEPASAGSCVQGAGQATSEDPQALKEKIDWLTARLAAAQRDPAEAPAPVEEPQHIEPIPRPKGEAGNRKNGFVLKEAMKLDEGEENEALYNQILRITRKNITRANLDLDALYRQQDAEKLANIFRMTRSKIPYLTRKRFPADWAIAEIVKQYLANQRKETRKKRKGRTAGKGRRARNEDQDSDDEQGEGAQSQTGDEFDSDDEEVARLAKRRKVTSVTA